MGVVKKEKFTQLEIFFDRSLIDGSLLLLSPDICFIGSPITFYFSEEKPMMKSPSGRILTPNPDDDGGSSFSSEKDIEFRQRFNLKSFDASIIHGIHRSH
jgi:hypothetical protein